MSDLQALALAARPRAPLAKKSDGSGEITVAISATHAVMAIPSWLAGKLCEFHASGAGADVLFGTSAAVEVTYGQASSIDGTTKAVTVNAVTGRRIGSGETRRWVMPTPDQATHMAVEASGDGTLHIGVVAQARKL